MTRAASAAADQPAVAERPAPELTGPSSPQHGVPPPAREMLLPLRDVAEAATVWWLGAHGGAGESSLAALWPESRAADHGWPRPPEPTRAAVVLVARSSLCGLEAAGAAAAQWATPGAVPCVRLLGLVVIADAPGRLPAALRHLVSHVGGGVPRVWRLPWIESWRTSPPSATGPPRAVRRLFDDVRSLT